MLAVLHSGTAASFNLIIDEYDNITESKINIFDF